jgi:hypothetical protein
LQTAKPGLLFHLPLPVYLPISYTIHSTYNLLYPHLLSSEYSSSQLTTHIITYLPTYCTMIIYPNPPASSAAAKSPHPPAGRLTRPRFHLHTYYLLYTRLPVAQIHWRKWVPSPDSDSDSFIFIFIFSS